MHIQFQATENFRAYNEVGLSVANGQIIEVDEKKGAALLSDYPKNFFKVTVEEIEIDPEPGETATPPAVEKAPNKMVTETKPYGQKRKRT